MDTVLAALCARHCGVASCGGYWITPVNEFGGL
jgi:hypothetical protein